MQYKLIKLIKLSKQIKFNHIVITFCVINTIMAIFDGRMMEIFNNK